MQLKNTILLVGATASSLVSAGQAGPNISGMQAQWNPPPNVTTVTTVVAAITTWCPEPTLITHNQKTYTVTAATTLTITDCPCTLTTVVPCSTPEPWPVPTEECTTSTNPQWPVPTEEWTTSANPQWHPPPPPATESCEETTAPPAPPTLTTVPSGAPVPTGHHPSGPVIPPFVAGAGRTDGAVSLFVAAGAVALAALY